jgi:hypothetical protein
MATGILDANGSTDWVYIKGYNSHVSANDTFGGGTMSLEKQILGETFPVYDNTTAIALTSPDDVLVGVQPKMKVRWTLSGATSPRVVWSIAEYHDG